jgi:glycosyltransferase involved in cell wall biosynthesis
MKNDLKVALVCDWLTGFGGAERVVLELHKMFPDAPIYTSQYNPNKIDWFKDADVRTGWLQKLPSGLKKFLPVLRARYFSRLNLNGYDLVISAGGAEAKAVRTDSSTVHINYCYAPTHYYWSRYDYYMKHPGFGAFNWPARLGLRLLVGPLRHWDRKAAQRADHVIAISTHIQKEIKKYYGRESVVIHPPVDLDRFKVGSQPRHGFVITGRQTPYKRIDLAVAACSQLDLPLTVIGTGPEHTKLERLAGPTVHFLTNASDAEVADELAKAEAFIFPGLDDFGISPVEAMAAGTPVIAYKEGGALDYVEDYKTGLFFEEQTIKSLVAVINKFKEHDFNHQAIRDQAAKFSAERFRSVMTDEIKSYLTD